MTISTAPALLFGLGARVLLNTITHPEQTSIPDFILFGVWQGVGLHYSSKISGLPPVVVLGIASKLLVEFNLLHDVTRSLATLLGIALGILSTEFLSQLFDSQEPPNADRRRKKPTLVENGHRPRRERMVQFRNGGDADLSRTRRYAEDALQTISDITSIDSNSEMLPTTASMSSSERLEREIKNLRTRASLADSERRRFKEERKWAISQGNGARASQMKWQVKRYTALMQSFHREADAKLIEASGGRPRQLGSADPKQSLSRQTRHRKEHSDVQFSRLSAPGTDTLPTKRASKPVS